jgi:hypothetical protein
MLFTHFGISGPLVLTASCGLDSARQGSLRGGEQSPPSLPRDNMADNCCYIIGDIKRACDSARTAGYSDSQIIQVRRTIDPTLLELNKRGYLNGHTPFSAIVAFSSLVFAYLSGKKYIVLSNESSANESNCQLSTVDCQLSVNHQYSKSTEFERDFREYVSRLSPELPEYFSLLRPWNELQITRAFTRFPKYFPVFQSCNVGTKTNTWCNNCAKCLYVYIMLAAFLPRDTVNRIFGEDLLEKQELSGLLEGLINPAIDKPFECVGTREEINAALSMIHQQSLGLNAPTSVGGILKCMSQNSHFSPNVYGTKNCGELLRYFDSDNFVPERYLKYLRS